MAKKKPDSGKPSGRKSDKPAYLATATDEKKGLKERVDAMRRAALQVLDSDENYIVVLKVLQDVNEPVEVRQAALQALQAATFRPVEFEPYRGEYKAALRKLVNDPNDGLRQRVLGILARDKDRPTQRKLLAGL